MRVFNKVVIATLGLSLSPLLHAAPWVKTDDIFLQQSIQLLANAGHLNTPVNTWPLMWQPLVQELANINTELLTQAELQAFIRIQSAASFAQHTRIRSATVTAATDPLGQRGFGHSYQQEAMLSLGVEVKDNNWTAAVYKNVRHDAFDRHNLSDNTHHWDGSYGAYTAGNWVLIAGIHQQWWGPAIHSSFNFNNQQRPTKSLQINRLNPLTELYQPFSWLGPVSINAQIGQYAGTAPNRHASYVATRLAAKPTAKLEVALTLNTVKPQTQLNNLFDNPIYLLPENRETRLGVDARYHLTPQAALYAEISNQRQPEQATGWLAGAQYHLGNATVLLRFYTEFQSIPQAYSQWLAFQPGAKQAPLKQEWVAGVQISTPTGHSGFVKYVESKTYLPVLTADTRINPSQLQLGYQQPLWKGLLNLEYGISRSNTMNTSAQFDHAAGIRYEWRW